MENSVSLHLRMGSLDTTFSKGNIKEEEKKEGNKNMNRLNVYGKFDLEYFLIYNGLINTMRYYYKFKYKDINKILDSIEYQINISNNPKISGFFANFVDDYKSIDRSLSNDNIEEVLKRLSIMNNECYYQEKQEKIRYEIGTIKNEYYRKIFAYLFTKIKYEYFEFHRFDNVKKISCAINNNDEININKIFNIDNIKEFKVYEYSKSNDYNQLYVVINGEKYLISILAFIANTGELCIAINKNENFDAIYQGEDYIKIIDVNFD